MQSWLNRDIIELLHEGETIQKNLTQQLTKGDIRKISKKFAALMSKGNVNAAINLLTDNRRNGILPLNNETLTLLRLKHPDPKDVPERIHPVKFEVIDVEMIRKEAMRTKRGSGFSGLDADGWKQILLSKNFGELSSDLCQTLAKATKKLCTEELSTSLEGFLAFRLLPLNKKPGLRPIGVGEVLRRIIGRVIASEVRNDIISSVGSLQVCAGHEAGSEAAIYAMRTIFEDEKTETVLLVDTFNSINRQVFLHKICIICPAIATGVRNCYTLPSRLFIIGGTEIPLLEGTTQGDLTAMSIYAIAIIPLVLIIMEIMSTSPDNNSKMVVYADDFTAGGTAKDLKYWWETLCEHGPKFGYYPEASKTWLIVKNDFYGIANTTFKSTKINVTSNGKRHLGAVTSSRSYKENYMNEIIDQRIKEVKLLSEIAKIEPQCALSCFISGYKHKLNYYMRTVLNISNFLRHIDDVITKEFIPAITGGVKCPENKRKLLSFPPKLGGLGIPVFSETSDFEYINSKMVTNQLCEKIIQQEKQYDRDNKIKEIKNNITRTRLTRYHQILVDVRAHMNENQQRLNDINQEPEASSCILLLPLEDEGYVLNKQLFQDLIRIRYGWELTRLPKNCACGVKFGLQHALSCKKGGFATIRHNQVRNITATLLNEICNDVQIEQQLQSLSGEHFDAQTANKHEDARLDISARGFWCSGQKALFDVRVFNPIASR